MRYRDDGSLNPDFVLNKPAYAKAKLCGGRQFRLRLVARTCAIGAAQLRRALRHLDQIRDIFYNNCFKTACSGQGVARGSGEDDGRRAAGANATLTVDLPAQEIRGPDGGVVRFEIDAFRKHCLIEGLDDIGLTMVEGEAIHAHERKAAAARPWV